MFYFSLDISHCKANSTLVSNHQTRPPRLQTRPPRGDLESGGSRLIPHSTDSQGWPNIHCKVLWQLGRPWEQSISSKWKCKCEFIIYLFIYLSSNGAIMKESCNALIEFISVTLSPDDATCSSVATHSSMLQPPNFHICSSYNLYVRLLKEFTIPLPPPGSKGLKNWNASITCMCLLEITDT